MSLINKIAVFVPGMRNATLSVEEKKESIEFQGVAKMGSCQGGDQRYGFSATKEGVFIDGYSTYGNVNENNIPYVGDSPKIITAKYLKIRKETVL